MSTPNYPHLGGTVSAKIMNHAEKSGQFAVETMLAISKHKDSKRQVTFTKVSAGTLITANMGAGTVTILAEESQFFPELRKRKVGGW